MSSSTGALGCTTSALSADDGIFSAPATQSTKVAVAMTGGDDDDS
jgi:hypothetical protein